MSRIPDVTREGVPQDQTSAFDEIVQQRGSVPTAGPISIMINVPEIAKRAAHLSEYLRSQSSVSQVLQELAMLVTARENNCRYIWNAHAASARQQGLRDEIVDGIRDRKELQGLSAAEKAVVDYGQEFFRTRRVSEGTFNSALAQFGVRGLTELTNLMGYYALLAFNINAFGAEPAEGGPEPILPA